MGLRSWIATKAINSGRSFGRALGCQLVVTVDNQRIRTSMAPPGSRKGKNWDPEMYYRGQMFYRDYVNPIKPIVKRNDDVEEKDQTYLYTEQPDDTDDTESPQRTMMASARYKVHMANDMISELVTPSEQWDKIFYGIILLGILMFFNMAISVLIATGAI